MAQMIPYMAAVGGSVGIKFKYGGKIGNTRDSHRLIAFAGEKGSEMQDRLVEMLFHAYFEINEDISDKTVLARIAAEAGVFGSKEEGLEFLKSEMLGPKVDKEVDYNQYRRGINGVPHFIIEGEMLVDNDDADVLDQEEVGGAQDPRVFEQIFSQIDKSEKKPVQLDGEACLPDGSNC